MSMYLIGIVAGAISVIVVLLAAFAWTLRKNRMQERDFLLLSQSLLPLFSENQTLYQRLRPQLVHSRLFTSSLKELKRSNERRIEAIRVLAHLDGPEVVPPLVGQLSADEEQVREEAVKALASLREEAALDVLVSYWRQDTTGLITEALTRRGPTVIPRVGILVTNPDPVLRLYSVDVLKRLGAPEGAPYLVDALRDAQATVRANAAFALGETGAPDIQPLISALKNDISTQVRLYAAESLVKTGGEEGVNALQSAFLALGEQHLQADAAVQLWNALRGHLGRLERLEETLRGADDLPAEAFRKWLNTGVTAGDVEAISLVAYQTSRYYDEAIEGLSRASITQGEQTVLEQLIRGLNSPGTVRSATLMVLESLPLSSSASARLIPELQSIIVENPPGEVRWQASAVLRRFDTSMPEFERALPRPSGDRAAPGFAQEIDWTVNGEADVSSADFNSDAIPLGPGSESEASDGGRAPVLILDEHGPFRRKLRGFLERNGAEVAGEAGNVLEAEALLSQALPEVIIFCSTSLPGHEVFLQQASQKARVIRVIFLAGAATAEAESQSVEESVPMTFVTRDAYQETVLEAVQRAGAEAAEE